MFGRAVKVGLEWREGEGWWEVVGKGVSRKMCGKAGIKTLNAEGNSKRREVPAVPPQLFRT